MFPTPRMNQNSNDVNRHESVQRKISEDEYIEEILEINFDADFAMKEEEDPGESDDWFSTSSLLFVLK